MSTITLKNNPIHTCGELPKIGESAPMFTLTKTDLSEVSLKDFAHQRIILNIFPSIDTEVCAKSVRHFNQEANNLKDTKVLCVSMDLPFAQKRFCAAEGLEQVIPVSAFRHPEFGTIYGLTIADSPLEGLLSRAIVIIDQNGKIIYTEQVPEITQEPNYQKALAACAR